LISESYVLFAFSAFVVLLISILSMATQLYTLTTIVLVLQVVYYDHLMSWWKKGGVEVLFPEVSEDRKIHFAD